MPLTKKYLKKSVIINHTSIAGNNRTIIKLACEKYLSFLLGSGQQFGQIGKDKKNQKFLFDHSFPYSHH
jgi:hypothetical protein